MKDLLIKSRELLKLLILPDRAQPAGALCPAPQRRLCSSTHPSVLSWMPREEVRAEFPWVKPYLSFPSLIMNAVLSSKPLYGYPHACASVSLLLSGVSLALHVASRARGKNWT